VVCTDRPSMGFGSTESTFPFRRKRRIRSGEVVVAISARFSPLLLCRWRWSPSPIGESLIFLVSENRARRPDERIANWGKREGLPPSACVGRGLIDLFQLWRVWTRLNSPIFPFRNDRIAVPRLKPPGRHRPDSSCPQKRASVPSSEAARHEDVMLKSVSNDWPLSVRARSRRFSPPGAMMSPEQQLLLRLHGVLGPTAP